MDTIYDDIKKTCKGCSTYRSHDCNITHYCILAKDMSLVYRCPCPQCMIKIMCETACDKYTEITIQSSYLERKYFSNEES